MRLIDADALTNSYDECPNGVPFFVWGECVDRFVKLVDAQPTVEVVPNNCGFKNGYYALKDGLWYKLDIKTKWDDAKMINVPPLKLENPENWKNTDWKDQE